MTEQIPLPELLAELAEVHGLGAALSLAREAGGSVISIPKTVTPRLKGRFGEPVATWLVESYPAEQVTVPLGPYAADRVRAEQLRRAIIEGDGSASAIARRFGIHARTVKRHRAHVRTGDADLPLMALLKQSD